MVKPYSRIVEIGSANSLRAKFGSTIAWVRISLMVCQDIGFLSSPFFSRFRSPEQLAIPRIAAGVEHQEMGAKESMESNICYYQYGKHKSQRPQRNFCIYQTSAVKANVEIAREHGPVHVAFSFRQDMR